MSSETEATFETEVCSRCGGCGEYSYNQRDGEKCWGCDGKGVTYTKRGAAAHKFYVESLCKVTGTLAVGDKVYEDMPRGWYVVESVTVLDNGLIDVCFVANSRLSGCQYYPHSVVRVAHAPEQKAEKLAAALAYQATLTKAGKPSKKVAE